MLNILAQRNILADVGGSFWMPPQASDMAGQIDWLFFFIFYICLFFFLLVLVLLVVFAWKYRYREGYIPPEAPKHSTALELTWTFIPTLIVIVIFFYGFKGYLNMVVPPQDAYEVDVTARMWSYTFTYPDGEKSNELHIPVNQDVVFVLSSDDVIHGFYLPVFRLKKDIVPGRYNKIWVHAKPEMVGKSFDIFCTQYCGQDHSSMRNHIVVQSPQDFKTWLGKLSGDDLPPAERGKMLWETRGCNMCHSTDGSATGKAPTWKQLFDTDVQTLDGVHKADENYLHEVISHPNIHPIAGFQPIMPPTEGLLNEKDIRDIIAYIETLSTNYHPKGATANPAAPASGPSK
jgi:cytochrome c oxidase subunit 2